VTDSTVNIPNTPPSFKPTESGVQGSGGFKLPIDWQGLLAQKGKGKTLGGIAFLVFLFFYAIGFYWSCEPDLLDVEADAKAYADAHGQQVVNGYVTTHTLITVASTLLDKPGGYISNDKTPPGIFMDNMPNWEFGVLQQVRDFSKVLRNDLSRAQSLGEENDDLSKAEPKFNVDNESWLVPAAENEYRGGINYLEEYLADMSAPNQSNVQFYSRADNLGDWLKLVVRRLGSLSKRLNASVGETRLNTNLAGEPGSEQSTSQDASITTKTSWWEIDDVFYEARGTSWALINLLHAIEVDFRGVLEKKQALASLQQIIQELEATQRMLWSPLVLNGSDFGLFANHSLVMSAYISRASSGLIELRDLLTRG